MKIKYQFIPQGSSAKAEKGKVYLDVGNDVCNGIIDNHTEKAGKHCSSYITYHNLELVKDMIDDSSDNFLIITHEKPDFDAILSSYIATKIALGKKLSENEKYLVDIADSIDSGSRPFGDISNKNILLYFYMIDDSNNIEKLKKGFELLNFVNKKNYTKEELLSDVPFEEENPFLDLKTKINDDYEFYLKDLSNGSKETIKLKNTSSNTIEEVDGLILRDPESSLFKFWARDDKINSPQGKGFTFLFVIFDNSRYIISVNPDTNYTLKGLGELLEIEESKKREIIGNIRKGENRKGYNSPDPWYDGRAPIHNYTIVDTPMNGTVLTEETIKKITFNTTKWIKN